jgi:hypothetical protein
MAKGKVAQRQDCMPPVADGGGKELEDKARPEATCMGSEERVECHLAEHRRFEEAYGRDGAVLHPIRSR